MKINLVLTNINIRRLTLYSVLNLLSLNILLYTYYHIYSFLLQITLGNDARFTLDGRFAEDDHQSKETEFVENTYESDLQTEKEKQLDILESILGTPFKTKFQETKKEIKPAK